MTFLEQRDCYRRLQTLKVKDFCVGSIVAVTRSDPHVAKGHVRFVCFMFCKYINTNMTGQSEEVQENRTGLCIRLAKKEKAHTSTLRFVLLVYWLVGFFVFCWGKIIWFGWFGWFG